MRVTRPAAIVVHGDRSAESPDAFQLGGHPMLAIYRTDLTAYDTDVGGGHPLREGRVDTTAWAALLTSVVISHNR